MDINSSLLNRAPSGEGNPASPTSVAARQMSKGHGRSSSLTGALFSMLSPSALVSTFSGSSENLDSPYSSSSAQGRLRSSSSASNASSSGWPEHGEELRSGPPTAPSGFGLGLGLPTGNQNGIVTHSTQHGRSRQGSNPPPATHSRRSSVAWIFGGGESTGSGAGDSSGTVPSMNPPSDADAPLPTFEVQPAMLAVDLLLAPGESRSYTYTVNLPDNLPPTFRGKAMRFSYELVVGLCRAGQPGSLAPHATPSEHSSGSANVSKVMKVPIRMYNNVVVDHPPKPYNLLWPVDKRMDLAMPSSQAKVIEHEPHRLPTLSSPLALLKSPSSTSGRAKGRDELEDFLTYTARLLDTLPPRENTPDSDPDPQAEELHVSGDDQAESPTTPSPPRRETASPEDMPEPQSPNLEPTTPTSSSTPSHMSLSPSRSASPSPLPSSSQSQHSLDKNTQSNPTSLPEVSQPPSMSNTRPAPRKPAMLDLDASPRGRLSFEFSDMSSRASSAVREDKDGEGMLGGGCREAVEILTRTQKKASYDVTKDGVKVAVLTFPKSSYRLGETISGVVEINERRGRARVLQLAAFLEAHESLPSSLSPPSANRHLKRTYTEHFSSYLLNTLRTTFSLDIPSDASPAFQMCVGTPKTVSNTPGGTTSFGGIEWKVRICLLVAVAGEDTNVGTEGVRFKGLLRDGPRGEWGSSWKALPVACPLEKPSTLKSRPPSLRLGKGRSANGSSRSSMDSATSPSVISARSASWTSFFASYLSPSIEREYHDGDELGDEEYDDRSSDSGGAQRFFGGSIAAALLEEDTQDEEELDTGYDGIKPDMAGGVGRGVDFGGGDDGWRNVKLEMVECEVPVRIWPGNTAFKAMDVVFEV